MSPGLDSGLKRGRHAMGAAPAPGFGRLPLRADAEGKAPAEINNVADRVRVAATAAEGLQIETARPEQTWLMS
jgi:hypothetical protein